MHSPETASAAADLSDRYQLVEWDVLVESYDDMRRIARAVLNRERSCSLGSIDLLNQTIVTRFRPGISKFLNPQHLLSMIGRAMRQTIIDRGRRRQTRQRPAPIAGASAKTVPPEWVLTIQREMDTLRKEDPRAERILYYRVVEERTWEEVAASVGLTVRSVRDYYSLAVSWLRHRLQD
jgi:DNA-directed RNA polymerase specialized sigma24 family protein